MLDRKLGLTANFNTDFCWSAKDPPSPAQIARGQLRAWPCFDPRAGAHTPAFSPVGVEKRNLPTPLDPLF